MTHYAKGTSVSSDRSRAEIDKLLVRYGASSFAFGHKEGAAMIAFEMAGKRVKFILPLPCRDEQRFTHYKKGNSYYLTERSDRMKSERYEQEVRERWRALVLCIKAKLESVESNIETFEEAFLPHIVTATGETIGELVLPQLPLIAETGKLPKLLT